METTTAEPEPKVVACHMCSVTSLVNYVLRGFGCLAPENCVTTFLLASILVPVRLTSWARTCAPSRMNSSRCWTNGLWESWGVL